MSLFRSACLLVLLTFGFSVVTAAQADKPFPTDEEINLVLTQTERAMQQYKIVIDQEEIQFGKSAAAADAIANDRQVVNALEMAVKALKGKPQGFNGPAGFAFFEWLDDAARNALLCGSGGSTQSTLNMVAGNIDKANDLLHLSQTCMDVSTLIYTVSENAGSLYQRYAEAEQRLAARSFQAVQECTDILKKNRTTPKK
jgi:hypothetical protein